MRLLIIVFFLFSSRFIFAQGTIRDVHITRQQERMVFKQWDRRQFTPRKGFLGLNPLYWLTWGLHPDYPKKDLRPLGPVGPQTQRLAMAAAMASAASKARDHSDTLRNTAISEAFNYSAAVSDLDPLWQLYYQVQFRPLLEFNNTDPLEGLSQREKQYLQEKGLLEWYREEMQILLERLRAARSTNIDRGSRTVAYHQVLEDYTRLLSSWEMKKDRMRSFLRYADAASRARSGFIAISDSFELSDRQIADKILSHFKL